ncbi:MAG: threonine/serine dehydratase [Acidimicrobiia bacterium]|nr:threonine/serine dehydratase [Acidimicrobiia bacterium]NNF69102.1 threonine/serine dehydratase [Acidimicrobiia bacterium]
MIDLRDIQDARLAVTPHVVRTPTVVSSAVSRRLGRRTRLKLESLQVTGSFKPRGAINQVLSKGEIDRGVVGVSGGNFAQGLAYAGHQLGVPVTVVMPSQTPANYVEGTRVWGAEIMFVDTIAEAFDAVPGLVADGWTETHPFDDPAMMAGNGTLGLEIIEEAPDLTDLVISVGGGGLIAGVASAVRAVRHDVDIWAVETTGADALSRSIEAGEPVTITPSSVAKTLGSPYTADVTIKMAQVVFEDVLVVDDDAALEAMRFLAYRGNVLAEPAASCTLAAAEQLGDRLGERPVLVICGGNVEPGLL